MTRQFSSKSARWTPHAATRSIFVCAMLAMGVAFVACGRTETQSGEAPPAAVQSAQLTEPDQVYTVRGRIVDLPDPARPASGFQIRHEAIDDFVAADGRVVGMDAMVMPFTPARELSLDGFAVGDTVELVFEVRWRTPPRSRVVEMTKLPAETELEFREARPPTVESGG